MSKYILIVGICNWLIEGVYTYLYLIIIIIAVVVGALPIYDPNISAILTIN